jgi:hypothetical protein
MAEALSRRPLNYVKTLVRESALDLREFSVEEIVKATGCKRPSVQSELRHMVAEGYLTTTSVAGPHQRPGKPSSVYRLVDDEEKLHGLIREVRAFRPRPEPSSPQLGQNYQLARQLLDRANVAPEAEQTALLATAQDLLHAAWAEEGDTGRLSDAFFKFEQGRLLSMKKDYEPASRLLQEAVQRFSSHQGYAAEREKAFQHLVSNILEQSMESSRSMQSSLRTHAAAWIGSGIPKPKPSSSPVLLSRVVERLHKAAQAVMRVDVGSGVENPLQKSLVRTLETVVESISPRKQLFNAAWNCISAGSTTYEPPTHKPWRDQYYGTYCQLKIEGTGQAIKVIKGEPVFYQSKQRDDAANEIELAVRGPVHPLRMPSGIMALKDRK